VTVEVLPHGGGGCLTDDLDVHVWAGDAGAERADVPDDRPLGHASSRARAPAVGVHMRVPGREASVIRDDYPIATRSVLRQPQHDAKAGCTDRDTGLPA